MMARSGPVTPNHKEYLGDVLSSAKHLLSLINDILDLSKVETGKFEFRPERLKLGKIIGEVRRHRSGHGGEKADRDQDRDRLRSR